MLTKKNALKTSAILLTILMIIFTACTFNEQGSSNIEDQNLLEDFTDRAIIGKSYVLDGSNFRAQYAVTDENWASVNFPTDFDHRGILVDVQTLEGSDQCAVRVRNSETDSVELKIEEEKSHDSEVAHTDEMISILKFATSDYGFIYDRNGRIIGGVIHTYCTMDNADDWHSKSLKYSINSPVVFGTVLTYREDEPCHVRIKNVTDHGFDYKIEEWHYQDGAHAEEIICFLFMEAGVHLMDSLDPDKGVIMEVGKVEVKAQTWNSNVNVYTKTPFINSGYPFVFTRCQTYVGSRPVVVRNTPLTKYRRSKSRFGIRLQEEESNDQYHAKETIGYMVIGEPSAGHGDLYY